MKKMMRVASLSVVLAMLSIAAARGAEVTANNSSPTIKAALNMYPQYMAGDFFARNWMKTTPHPLKLSETKPDGITNEPQYKGKPLYGSIRFGDDDSAPAVWVVMDDEGNRVFIDSNQDNDLTNDSPIPWDKVTKTDDKTGYEGNFVLPAHWKTGAGKYGIKMYRPKGSMAAWWQTVGAPTGVITIDGNPYVVYLYDRGGKGMFDAKADADGKTPGTSIFIDTDGDGTCRPLNHTEDTLIGEPFQVARNGICLMSRLMGKNSLHR